MSSSAVTESKDYIYGHRVYQAPDGLWYWVETDLAVFERTGTDDPADPWTRDGIRFNVPPCPACNRKPVVCERCPEEPYHDPCLGHIEGVRSACCGHGVYTGQIIWPGVNPSKVIGGAICDDDGTDDDSTSDVAEHA